MPQTKADRSAAAKKAAATRKRNQQRASSSTAGKKAAGTRQGRDAAERARHGEASRGRRRGQPEGRGRIDGPRRQAGGEGRGQPRGRCPLGQVLEEEVAGVASSGLDTRSGRHISWRGVTVTRRAWLAAVLVVVVVIAGIWVSGGLITNDFGLAMALTAVVGPRRRGLSVGGLAPAGPARRGDRRLPADGRGGRRVPRALDVLRRRGERARRAGGRFAEPAARARRLRARRPFGHRDRDRDPHRRPTATCSR